MESEPEILEEEDESSNIEDDVGLDKNTHKRVTTFGSKFSVMNELFIQPGVFLVERPSRVSSLVPTRYNSAASKRAGIIAELYEEVSEDCHILLETNLDFRQTVSLHSNTFFEMGILTGQRYIQFIKSLNANRRQIVYNLRNRNIAAIVFKQSLQLYKLGAVADRSKLPDEFRKALFAHPDRNPKFSKYAPILFPNGLVEDKKKLFRCKHLALVRVLLFYLSRIVVCSNF